MTNEIENKIENEIENKNETIETATEATEPTEAGSTDAEQDETAEEQALHVREEVLNGGVVVRITRKEMTDEQVENVKLLISNKAEMIKKCLGVDNLDIELDGDFIVFPWIKKAGSIERIRAFQALACLLVNHAKGMKRVRTPRSATEKASEKYRARCFLLSLGFVGAKYKEERKTLLAGFTGSSAYAYKSAAKVEEVEAEPSEAETTETSEATPSETETPTAE